jgi:hypothetical protein
VAVIAAECGELAVIAAEHDVEDTVAVDVGDGRAAKHAASGRVAP